MFSSGYSSEGMRASLRRLRGVPSAETEVLTRTPGVTPENVAEFTPEPVTHPVMRRHPVTGRHVLFANPYYTRRFEGMTEEESRPLIDYLARHAVRPEYVYRHRWHAGDLLVFDNRATMHFAIQDYDGSMPRLLHRSTVEGTGRRREAMVDACPPHGQIRALDELCAERRASSLTSLSE